MAEGRVHPSKFDSPVRFLQWRGGTWEGWYCTWLPFFTGVRYGD
jgi:hypothetical protein